MIEQDTVKLLRECDAGVKMGVSSIDEVLDHVKDAVLADNLWVGDFGGLDEYVRMDGCENIDVQ